MSSFIYSWTCSTKGLTSCYVRAGCLTRRVLIPLLYSIINLSKTIDCYNSPFDRRAFYSASSEINQHPAWSVERHYFTPDTNASDQSGEKTLARWESTDIEQRYENLVLCTISLFNNGSANKPHFPSRCMEICNRLKTETISYHHVHDQAKVSTLLLIAAFFFLSWFSNFFNSRQEIRWNTVGFIYSPWCIKGKKEKGPLF